MLLEQQEKFRIVKSGRAGLWQHDPFSWVVEGNDFCFLEELTPDAQYLDKTLNRWLGSLTTAERERFVDSLYGLVDAAHIETLAQLRSRWQESVPAILRAASQLDPDTKEFLFQTGMALVSLGVKNFPEMLEGSGGGTKGGLPKDPFGRPPFVYEGIWEIPFYISRLSATSFRVWADFWKAERSSRLNSISSTFSAPSRPTTAGTLMHRSSTP